MNTNPLGIRRIDHVAWTVAELAPVIAFYQRVFGARILYGLGPFDAAEMPLEADGRDWMEAHLGVAGAQLELCLLGLPGGVRLELFAYKSPPSSTTSPLPGNHIGAHHLGLEVDDMEAAAQLLRDNGCTVFERIAFSEGPTAGSQYQYFRDPWDNVLELVVHGRPF
jgi:glyoxylase I family protein